MTTVPFVDLGAQYAAIKDEVDPAIARVISECNYVLGPQVVEFEQTFAKFAGCEHAIGVGSGLDALRLALMGLDVGPGDEVILPANTYIATSAPSAPDRCWWIAIRKPTTSTRAWSGRRSRRARRSLSRYR